MYVTEVFRLVVQKSQRESVHVANTFSSELKQLSSSQSLCSNSASGSSPVAGVAMAVGGGWDAWVVSKEWVKHWNVSQ